MTYVTIIAKGGRNVLRINDSISSAKSFHAKRVINSQRSF